MHDGAAHSERAPRSRSLAPRTSTCRAKLYLFLRENADLSHYITTARENDRSYTNKNNSAARVAPTQRRRRSRRAARARILQIHAVHERSVSKQTTRTRGGRTIAIPASEAAAAALNKKKTANSNTHSPSAAPSLAAYDALASYNHTRSRKKV